jgi:hypothetical protein
MSFLRNPIAVLAAALFTVAAQAQTAVPPRPAASAPASKAPASAPAPRTVSTATPSKRLDFCEKRAGDRTGEARSNHVQACMRTGTAQQNKMKECNAAAKGKKGDDRRAFMSQCLRKKKS